VSDGPEASVRHAEPTTWSGAPRPADDEAVDGGSRERARPAPARTDPVTAEPVAGDPMPAAEATPAGDELPAELDVTAFVGPYTFPDISRRRIAGTCYLVMALGCAAGWLATDNHGLLGAAVALTVIALIHFVCAWHVAVDETEALVIATREVGFPVGHASAAMAWRGWRSRPEWRILVYSAEEPPTQRGIVQVNAVTGDVDGSFTQPNPEDWSQLH
jgi:hypothetical protein